MGNPYGIALNRAWTEWATECALAPGEMLPQTAPTARNETAEAGDGACAGRIIADEFVALS